MAGIAMTTMATMKTSLHSRQKMSVRSLRPSEACPSLTGRSVCWRGECQLGGPLAKQSLEQQTRTNHRLHFLSNPDRDPPL